MLIRERDDELHLLSAVSPEWLKEGAEIRVSRAPTRFGEMDLSVKRRADRITIDIARRFHTSPQAVVIHVPWYLRGTSAPAEWRLAGDASRAELRVPRGAKLPEMNYAAAVRDLLEEFERTKPYWSEYVKTGKKPAGMEEPK